VPITISPVCASRGRRIKNGDSSPLPTSFPGQKKSDCMRSFYGSGQLAGYTPDDAVDKRHGGRNPATFREEIKQKWPRHYNSLGAAGSRDTKKALP
jgi:hypothetical protein